MALATDHGIAVSDYIHGIMAASPYGRRPITTIRHGIDTNFFAPPPPDSRDKLRELIFGRNGAASCCWAAPAAPTTTGLAGPGGRRRALPPEDKARVLLMVAGDPPSEASGGVRELGMIDQVRFPGLLDDVRASLASCHAGFVLSYREALSFACREIMGLGLPAWSATPAACPRT